MELESLFSAFLDFKCSSETLVLGITLQLNMTNSLSDRCPGKLSEASKYLPIVPAVPSRGLEVPGRG